MSDLDEEHVNNVEENSRKIKTKGASHGLLEFARPRPAEKAMSNIYNH